MSLSVVLIARMLKTYSYSTVTISNYQTHCGSANNAQRYGIQLYTHALVIDHIVLYMHAARQNGNPHSIAVPMLTQ